WDWRFTALLAAATGANWWFAREIARSDNDRRRRRLLRWAIAFDLGLLGFFKYYGFMVDSVADVFESFGLEPELLLIEIILPVGISFFTFVGISYVVDVYRRKLEPAGALDFAVFMSFFPRLIAGPIVRGSEFLPQLHPPRDPKRIEAGRAFYLIFIGLAKKIVIADLLATSLVDPVFASPQLHSGLAVLIGVYGYAVQIYADFSAYSDIAIGVALLLGFKLPDNFNAPYTATSIGDFWHRWHMTLSRWLRDYLYIGLGGNRRGRLLTYRNLMLTMLLGGLWHGAAWRFVIWGGLHGLWLCIERWWGEARTARGMAPVRSTAALRTAQRIATFHLVAIAWVFFRADSVGAAWHMLTRVVTDWSGETSVVTPAILLAIVVGFAAQYVPQRRVAVGVARFARLRPVFQGALLGFTLMVIDALGSEGVALFIYYSF
ncbi:MAG: MBOAT family protein, partial [Acidimicrobiia bacterium]|nr:MBOAT family protein [Acidimicrobiia bacterium]